MKPPILPWNRATRSELSGIRGVCLDIDDTLSTDGQLTPGAFAALWRLHDAGFIVVPVTGRPAGWCDHIARFWPVDAVVGENGAFTFFMERGVRRRIDTPGAPSKRARDRKLAALGKRIRARFPGARWASDQSYREFDLAIDFREDVKPWPKRKVRLLVDFCERVGARAKVSSIHVNAWFGDYDKVSGFRHWLEKGSPGLRGAPPRLDEWIFVGDSPNDEPMFEAFRSSVGVANLADFADDLRHPPRWITRGRSGAGFEEMVLRLIRVKRA